VPRSFAGVAELAPVVRSALGGELVAVSRLAGGSKKGVYRLGLAGGGSAVAYIWTAAEDYWPAREGPQDVFTDASGPDLFRASHDALAAAGIRTPRLLWADGDVALVEEVRGGTLESLLAREPAAPALAALAELLATMAAATSTAIGKVARPDRSGRSCARIVLDMALRDLAEAAARVPAIDAARSALTDRLRAFSVVGPRTGHALVHGELGGDHVLLDDAGAPVLIDIEGLAYFDVEWEHAFLEMRFGADAYEPLRPPGLDPDRMRFYRLARHLSLVAGPLRLLDGDFPDREFMLEISAHHTDRVLSYLS
jgi:hypothetical protein